MGNAGELIIGTKIDTKSFDAQIEYLWDRLEDIERVLSDQDIDSDEFLKLNSEAEKLRNQLKDLIEKKEELEQPSYELFNWSEDFGKSLKRNILKIGRLTLGIFGIRGAYMAVRSAMNTIMNDDEQLKADINYMKSALAYAIEPIIRSIVNLAKQLLYFIGAVAYLLIGKNIFENANKSLNNANKKASKLHKTLASFDEMNILQDTSGGDNAALPSFDLPTDMDSVIAKVEQLKSKWFDFGESMRKSLFDMPFEVWTKAFGEWGLAVQGVTQTVYGLWEMVTGFFKFFQGIAEIIYGTITGDTEMIKKGQEDLIEGIKLGLQGLRDFVIGLAKAVFGLILGLFVSTFRDALKNLEDFVQTVNQKFLDMRDKIKNIITNIQTWLTEKFGIVGTTIGNVLAGSITGIVNTILGFVEGNINGFFRNINRAIDVINVLGVNIKKLPTISFPRLAQGGIINMPGRGVPIGGAIGGESGREGVIPLTDSQQMELLGEAIGKYINVNATIPVYVGNRQVAREIRKINAEDAFAGNR